MATIVQKRQQFIRYFEQQTGQSDLDMHEVARVAQRMGWKMPVPPDPLDMLAKQFAQAASEEIRRDKETKRPYRARLAITNRLPGGRQLSFWIDVDQAPRHKVVKALHLYREHVVSATAIGLNTAEHWNNRFPEQEEIPFPTDMTDDVLWRRNAPVDTDAEGEEEVDPVPELVN